jgi:sugar/nucleoside kinase (ribokinase family)
MMEAATSAQKRLDVLALGCVAVDEILYLASYPSPDSKVPVLRGQRQCGGQSANALITAARLGAACAYAGQLGQEEDSQFVVDQLQRAGINLDHVQRSADVHPIRCTILVEPINKTRTILYDLNGTVGAPLDVPPAVIQAARVVLVDHYGIEGMTRATEIAQAAGIPVVADFEDASGPGFRDLLAKVDHLILSSAFACQLTAAADHRLALRRLWNEQRRVVILTAGERGCWFVQAAEPGTIYHLPAFVVPVVDTTGCGDAFHGAYAAALAWGWDTVKCLRHAAATAALRASLGEFPTRSAVERLLQQQLLVPCREREL